MARRRYSWGWGGYGYFHHTTTAEIEETARKALVAARKKGLTYHPVVIVGRTIAHSWWGKSWCDNLERYADYANRLPRGRTYVRHNAVIDLELGKGEAHAKVQGSSLYTVDIAFDPLNPTVEKELSGICSEQIQNVEELVSGKFPVTLKDRLFAKDGLFPSPKEIHFKCSCPDWASMCKHVAAVMYGIGARLDEEPLGFFDLRGIRTEEFVAKAVKSKVEGMLKNAASHSSRVINDSQLEDLFGLELGEAMAAPATESEPLPDPALKTVPEAEITQKRRGRPRKNAAETPREAAMPTGKTVGSESSAESSAKKPGKRRKRQPQSVQKKQPSRPDVNQVIQQSGYSEKIKTNLLLLSDQLAQKVFGSAAVMEILDCSPPTALSYLKRLHEELKLIEPVESPGKGTKYRFI